MMGCHEVIYDLAPENVFIRRREPGAAFLMAAGELVHSYSFDLVSPCSLRVIAGEHPAFGYTCSAMFRTGARLVLTDGITSGIVLVW
jgi:hypothetical protein